MLMSVAACSKPFLWAIVVPVMCGGAVAIVGSSLGMSAVWWWREIVGMSPMGRRAGSWFVMISRAVRFDHPREPVVSLMEKSCRA